MPAVLPNPFCEMWFGKHMAVRVTGSILVQQAALNLAQACSCKPDASLADTTLLHTTESPTPCGIPAYMSPRTNRDLQQTPCMAMPSYVI